MGAGEGGIFTSFFPFGSLKLVHLEPWGGGVFFSSTRVFYIKNELFLIYFLLLGPVCSRERAFLKRSMKTTTIFVRPKSKGTRPILTSTGGAVCKGATP
jgi:hypothetical protein